jgi:hypothetical protein
MAHDRGCGITEIQPHTVTIEQKERNSILLVQQRQAGECCGLHLGVAAVGTPELCYIRGC